VLLAPKVARTVPTDGRTDGYGCAPSRPPARARRPLAGRQYVPTVNYVDVDSFGDRFPGGMPVPPRLAALVRWMGDLGDGPQDFSDRFILVCEPLEEAATDDPVATARLQPSLGIFLAFPDGSQLALWDHGGPEPAVVELNSEGGLTLVATTFDDFLLDWCRGDTRTELDWATGGDDIGESATLRAWVTAQGVHPSGRPAPPDFEAWYRGVLMSSRRERAGLPAVAEPVPPLPEHVLAAAVEPTGEVVLGLLGARMDDARMAAALAGYGLDRLPDRIAFADHANGVVSLRAANRNVSFEVFQQGARDSMRYGEWTLYLVEYRRGRDGVPGATHLPYGISFDETRDALRARLGTPEPKGLSILMIDRWKLDGIDVVVNYDSDDARPYVITASRL